LLETTDSKPLMKAGQAMADSPSEIGYEVSKNEKYFEASR